MDQFQNDTELPLKKKKKVLAPDEHLLNTTFVTQIQRGFVCLCVYPSTQKSEGWMDRQFLSHGRNQSYKKSTERARGWAGEELVGQDSAELERSLPDSILPGNTGQPKGPLQEHSVRYYKSIKQMEGNNLRRPATVESCPQLWPNEASKAWKREELQPCRRMGAIKEKGISLVSLPFAPSLFFSLLLLSFSRSSLFLCLSSTLLPLFW